MNVFNALKVFLLLLIKNVLFLKHLLKGVRNIITMGNVQLVFQTTNSYLKIIIANLRDVLREKKKMNIVSYVKLAFMMKMIYVFRIKMEVKILVLMLLIFRIKMEVKILVLMLLILIKSKMLWYF